MNMFNICKSVLRNQHLQFVKKCIQNNRVNFLQHVKKLHSIKPTVALMPSKKMTCNILMSSSLLTWLGFADDEDKESELITTLKRSILLMQRGELSKAEQMLHIALRLAQAQGNYDGVTYAYDLMANLALERSEFDKAEKLFVNVLQRLLTQGLAQEDIKVIHISVKLARIYETKNELDKAEVGFLWCLDTLQKYHNIDNVDVQTLHGVIQDYYAHFLLQKGQYSEGLKYLEAAYKIYSEMEDADNRKLVLLLNDLGTANWQVENYSNAHEYLSRALTLGKKLDDFEYLGVVYANFGLVKFKQGILSEAQKYCTEGWRIGHKQNNSEAINQAKYCLDQLKSVT